MLVIAASFAGRFPVEHLTPFGTVTRHSTVRTFREDTLVRVGGFFATPEAHGTTTTVVSTGAKGGVVVGTAFVAQLKCLRPSGHYWLSIHVIDSVLSFCHGCVRSGGCVVVVVLLVVASKL